MLRLRNIELITLSSRRLEILSLGRDTMFELDRLGLGSLAMCDTAKVTRARQRTRIFRVQVKRHPVCHSLNAVLRGFCTPEF